MVKTPFRDKYVFKVYKYYYNCRIIGIMIKINNTNIYIGLERYEIRQSKICFNICRENGEREDYELNDDATIEDLVEIISRELEEVKTKGIVYVNYRFPREKQVLNNGDEVLVMPLYAGG